MATYLILNLIFLAAVVLFLKVPIGIPGRKKLLIATILIVLTIIFDSMLVGFGIVGYDMTKILQIYIGNAPIEDFFYSIMAVILIPYLWNFFERKK